MTPTRDIYHDSDPSNVKVVGNPPLEQEWAERPPNIDEVERREMAQAHRGEVIEDSGVALLRHRQTPSERKAYALEQAVQYGRSAMETFEMSIDELSIDSAEIAHEEYEAVVPVLAAYLDRIERRHDARVK